MKRRMNVDKRRQAAELRAQGLTLREIGERLGVLPSAVSRWLRTSASGNPAPLPVRCCRCRSEIPEAPATSRIDPAALCLRCLTLHPETPFGQRLKAFRLAAGLTEAELARRSGVPQTSLSTFELRDREPCWSTLVKLVRVLGVGLMIIEDPAAAKANVKGAAPRKGKGK
jgi:transcriptional regulator with XRE-family HTH domain